MMEEYIIIEKEKSEFQKLLNQWKHQFSFEIIWITYNTHKNIYHALIKKEAKHD